MSEIGAEAGREMALSSFVPSLFFGFPSGETDSIFEQCGTFSHVASALRFPTSQCCIFVMLPSGVAETYLKVNGYFVRKSAIYSLR